MTLSARDLRMVSGFAQFPTELAVKTLTIGFSDRDAAGDAIILRLPQYMQAVRVFCAIEGGSTGGLHVHTDISLGQDRITLNVPAVTGEESNYDGWAVVEVINLGGFGNPGLAHGEDDSGSNDT